MKSTCTTPAIVDPEREVPLEVTVHPDDVAGLMADHAEADWVAAGMVAERVARESGYRMVEVDRVERDGDTVHVDAWAVGA